MFAKIVKALRSNFVVIFLLGAGLLLRILLSHTLTFFIDFYIFQFWSLDLVQLGFSQFYQSVDTDYLPGYLYVLMLVGKVFYWFLNHGILLDMQLVYKLPSIISDIANSLLIYLISRKYLSPRLSLWTLVFAIFNLALIANSTFWGQADSFISFFILLSVYLLIEHKYELSAVVLGLAQAIKPVAILLIPTYLVWLAFHSIPLRRIIQGAGLFLLSFFLLFIPFYSQGNFFQFVWDRLMITTGFYPLVSVNAFNFWGLFQALNQSGVNTTDTSIFLYLSYKHWGYFICIIAILYLNFKLIKILKSATEKQKIFFFILTLQLVYLIFFLFFTRLHERHFYYALIFSNITYFYFNKLSQKLILILPFLIYLANLYYSYAQFYLTQIVYPPYLLILLPSILMLYLGFLLNFLHLKPKN